MADRTYLSWPFFDEQHRELASAIDSWAEETVASLPGQEQDVDQTCRFLVFALAAGGWLRHAVPRSHGGASDSLDVRTLSLIRETLARHSDALGGVEVDIYEMDYGERGHFYRILAGPVHSADAANELCRRLREDNPQEFCKVLTR